MVLVAFAGPQIRDPLNLTGAGCIPGATEEKTPVNLIGAGDQVADTVDIHIHDILQAWIKSCDQSPSRRRQTNH